MNSLQSTREMMQLSRKEFGLLLGWSEYLISELESLPDSELGELPRPIILLLQKHPQQRAHELLESRISNLPPNHPDLEALSVLVRKVKIIGGTTT